MGRTAYKPTKKIGDEVARLAGRGMPIRRIAHIVKVSHEIIARHHQDDFDRGRSVAMKAVQDTAYQMAVSGEHPNMTMFWLKTQCGWRETSEVTINQNVTHKNIDEKTVKSMAAEVLKLEPKNAKRKKA